MENQNLLIKCFSIWLLFLMLSLTFVLNNAEAADDTPYEPAVWKGNVTAGGNFQTGNTDRFNAAIGADALRKSDKERYSLNFLFNYSEEDGRNTAESYYGAGKYDYFFTGRIYWVYRVGTAKGQIQGFKPADCSRTWCRLSVMG